MALNLGIPVGALGYGADHNRVLLRDLALTSRGAYIYCDSDEVLPTAIGGMITELRTQVCAKATVTVDSGDWICQELGSTDTDRSFVLGSIVPDRDYWVVYRSVTAAAENPVIRCDAPGASAAGPTFLDNGDLLKEQVLRCRVAALLGQTSDCLESHRDTTVCLAALRALEAEIAAESAEFRLRSLPMHLQAELVGLIGEMTRPHRSVSPALMARMSSQTAYLSSQRGPSTADPSNDLFNSPTVRVGSNQTRAAYDSSRGRGRRAPSPPPSPSPYPMSPPPIRRV